MFIANTCNMKRAQKYTKIRIMIEASDLRTCKFYFLGGKTVMQAIVQKLY